VPGRWAWKFIEFDVRVHPGNLYTGDQEVLILLGFGVLHSLSAA
jgi:hypothetical protein